MSNTIVYAGRVKKQEILESSSSGGAFTALSDFFIKNGNIVIATVYNYETHIAEFKMISSIEERDRAKGSKYMQSKPGDIFRKAYSWLLDNPSKKLLFIGTGCQSEGFRKFSELKKVRDRVYIIDIICHGVPSPKIWREYAFRLHKQYGKISYLTFKDKRNGWMSPTALVKVNQREIFIKDYVKIYYDQCALRLSCHECPFTTTKRNVDMTIGDFWHIDQTIPDFYNEKGNSLFLIHTPKGLELFENIKCDLEYRESNIIQCWQENLEAPTNKPEYREEFWLDYHRKGIKYIMKKYGTEPIKVRVKNRILKVLGGGIKK